MKLSKNELQQLIDTYQSELRLLSYRSKQIAGELKELGKLERAAKPKGKSGRPAKKAKRARPAKKATAKRARPAKKATAKRARPAKKATAKRGKTAKKAGARKVSGKGYRLNVWDEIVLKSVGTGKKVGVFANFLSAAKRNSASRGMSEKDLYARINQSLHKLANKRGVLKKVPHEGRGFGYTLTSA